MYTSLKDNGLKTTALGLLFASTLALSPAKAEDIAFEGNIGLTSNYVWRGMTQTDDQAAISGGLDLAMDSFYLGTWVSNVDFGDDTTSEQDIYFGYAGEAGSVSYDVGYISYIYAGGDDLDFAEIYASVGTGGFSLTYSYLVSADWDADSGDETYLSLDYEFPIAEDVGVSVHFGLYDKDSVEDEQTDYGVTISKGDFAFTISNVDDAFFPGSDEDVKAFVSYGLSF